MSIDRLDTMLQMQLGLQKMHMGGDPRDLEGDQLADFLRWNAFALTDEIHEAMAEVGWKPWATSRHVNRGAFMKEMVDAWHFFMNMLLAANPGRSPEDIMTEFFERYSEKNAVNAQRQVEGYDGVSTKCSHCHREISEVKSGLFATEDEDLNKYCSSICKKRGVSNG
mgnify:CR=1 FL=1